MNRIDASVERILARVSAHWENQEYETGYNILLELIAEEPGCGKAHSYMGWYCYAQAGDYILAARHYDLALKFNPNFAGTYPNYTQVLISLGKYEDAIALARRGMQIGGVDKSIMAAEAGRGEEYLRRYRAAIAAYRNAYQLCENRQMMEEIRGNIARVRSKRRASVFAAMSF